MQNGTGATAANGNSPIPQIRCFPRFEFAARLILDTPTAKRLDEIEHGTQVTATGIVTHINQHYQSATKISAVIVLTSDIGDTGLVHVSPHIYRENAGLLTLGKRLSITGTVSVHFTSAYIKAQEITHRP
ncbi:hypothetical protein [Streptomyces angustmyceticus]|uniref:hypothetical protein n=1 Tax=Streptomyces angustmyceticus TaxID=285578 RepID=UPI00344F0183